MELWTIILVTVVVIWLWNSLVRIREGECGVVLRLGRIMPELKQPGLRLILWPTETVYKVSLLEQAVEVPAREFRVDEDRTLCLGAKLTFRVVDALRAISQVHNYRYALSALAETSLGVIVKQQADEKYLPSDGALGEMLQRQLEEDSKAWGIQILNAEVQAS